MINRLNFNHILCLPALFLCLAPLDGNATAISSKMEAHASKYCTQQFARQERKHGIPGHLLHAIAITESGRWHKGANKMLPWPWTINVEGKGHFFKNRHDAVTAVHRLQQRGKTSIDIGCMQVNLKHHPEAFTSVLQGFKMSNNVEYAASLLKSHHKRYGSWGKAIAAYHSKTPHLGQRYLGKVKKNWKKVIADRKRNKDGEVDVILAENDSPSSFSNVEKIIASLDKPATRSIRTKTSLNKSTKRSKSNSRKGSSLKVIRASNKNEPRNLGVLVIRPEKNQNVGVSVEKLSSQHTVTKPFPDINIRDIQNFVSSPYKTKQLKKHGASALDSKSGSGNKVFIY